MLLMPWTTVRYLEMFPHSALHCIDQWSVIQMIGDAVLLSRLVSEHACRSCSETILKQHCKNNASPNHLNYRPLVNAMQCRMREHHYLTVVHGMKSIYILGKLQAAFWVQKSFFSSKFYIILSRIFWNILKLQNFLNYFTHHLSSSFFFQQ